MSGRLFHEKSNGLGIPRGPKRKFGPGALRFRGSRENGFQRSVIVFIVNFSHHFLQNILERDDPQPGLLRRHDAHVHTSVLQ